MDAPRRPLHSSGLSSPRSDFSIFAKVSAVFWRTDSICLWRSSDDPPVFLKAKMAMTSAATAMGTYDSIEKK